MSAAPDPPSATPATLQLSQVPQALGVDGQVHRLAAADALLLAWLAVEGPTPRDRLAALLWPQSSAEQARNALRQRLFRLRRQAGRDLVGGGLLLALADGVAHDLDGSASLLGSLTADEFPGLADWLTLQRTQRRAAARRDIEAKIAALEAVGDAAAALPLAQALLDSEPLSEDTHRRVMRLHYLCGDRAAALLAFDRLEAMLKHDVGTAPSAQTLALLQAIESAAPPAPPSNAPAWRSDLPAAVQRPPRLIGRDADLAALRSGWLGDGLVTVIGEAGMGKSRLLQAWSALNDGIVSSAARPGDALVPYASLARLLQLLIQRAPQALSSLDVDTRGRLAPLLPALIQAAEPAARSRQAPLAAPLAALLLQAAAVVDGLVLDDLHFADDASLDLLQALLAAPRGAVRLCWCLGLRPPAPGSRPAGLLAALADAGPHGRVVLQPLSEAQMRELVDSLALPGVVGADVAGPLRQRSGGNPLFALETLKLAWAEGTFDGGGELPRPQSLGQLIGQQLARLSAPALMLARLAAVAGVDFSLPLAEKVLGQHALQLADPWFELETQQVIIGTDFAHDLLCEAVLGGIPTVIARHLHGLVAQTLEGAAGEPARIAAHWEAAGQSERALPSLRAAAASAHRALREQERLVFLLRAADIAESAGAADQAYDCVAQAVETHMNSIRQADGFPLLDRLDRLAQSPLQTARALGLRAWYCSQLADAGAAVAIGERALALAEPLGDRMLSGQIRQRLATALSLLGRFDAALPHLEAVQAWADDELAPDDLAEFRGNFAVVLDNLGRPDLALPHHQRALDASFAAGDHAQHATQLANQAVNRLNAGDVATAGALVAQARQLTRTFALHGGSAGFVTVLQMQCARAAGRYHDALALGDEAEALLRASIPARLPVVALHRGHCWLDLGQFARAVQSLQAASGGLPAHFETRRLLLLARLRRWQGQDAAALVDAADAAAPANGWPEVRMMVAVERACLLPADRAAALLESVCGQAGVMGLEGSLLAASLRLAALIASADKARQALQLAQRVEPSLLYRGEVWSLAASALHAAGCAAEAAAVAREGLQWLGGIVEQQVDGTWRDSFLQRNPVNLLLRRLGAP